MTVRSENVRRDALLATLAGMAACVALVVFVPDLHDLAAAAFRGDTGEVRERLDGLGWSGVALLLTLIMVHAVVPYPSEIPNAAAGYVYGFWLALPIVVVSWMASAIATYYMGRYAGRPAVLRLAGAQRVASAERRIDRGGVGFLLAARLIPIVPFSLIGYVAGVTRVTLWRFCWTTGVGFLPLTVAVVYLGSRLESLHPSDPRLWVAAIPLVLAAFATLWVHRRRERADGHEPSSS